MALYDLTDTPPSALLALYVDVLAQLRQRAIIRSTNNPVADYAEYLVAQALGVQLAAKSTTGYDAIGSDGERYEVKARRLTASNLSRQLSAIRGLPERHFDYLAGVLFAEDFTVARACLVPISVVEQEATYRSHVNAWILHLRDSLWARGDVRDITAAVRAAAADEARRVSAETPPEVTVASADAGLHLSDESAPPDDHAGRQTTRPAATYTYSRFCFKADVIERLGMDEAFRVVTPMGTFQMTKAEFYCDFPKVPASKSYRVDRIYHYPKLPERALRHLVSD